MKTFVSEIKEGMEIKSKFLVTHKEIKPFNEKPGSYLYLRLLDKTGSIIGICWNNAEEATKKFDVDDVIEIKAKAIPYGKQIELLIDPESIRKPSQEETDIRDFVSQTTKDINKMLVDLFEYIDSVSDKNLQKLLKAFFEDKTFLEEFKLAPAAISHHHNYVGGLLEHTLSVLEICNSISRIYPELNRDLLITGAILHDVGKTKEYVWKPKIDVTTEGGFAGHAVLGANMMSKKFSSDFPEELKIKLYHMILSHHGREEWGAVVTPRFAEACALHYAENLDAKVKEFIEIEKREKGRQQKEWSYSPTLSRYIYLGEKKKEKIREGVEEVEEEGIVERIEEL